jgi:hypothetical protein
LKTILGFREWTLLSYKNLSEEEHNSIIQRMVLGDIADRDAIVEYVRAC